MHTLEPQRMSSPTVETMIQHVDLLDAIQIIDKHLWQQQCVSQINFFIIYRGPFTM